MCHKLKAPLGKGLSTCRTFVFLSLALLTICPRLIAGTWAPLAHAPPAGLNNALLMGDGTVMCGDGGSGWYRLTPDIHGSYVNGTWTVIASTHYTRLFYTSAVLTNGNLYVAGGEYGTGRNHAELYNFQLNSWSDVPQPASDPAYSDAISKILPGGNVLQGTTGGGVWIYNPTLNSITAAASARNQNEACWVKLTNDCVLTVDAFGVQSEHYVPSLNTWVTDGNVPVSLYGWGGEMGAGFVLPNGNVFYIGGTTHTAIYTPGATPSSAGTWVAGPEMVFGTNGLGAVDAPAAMMANGKILCAIGPTNGFNGPTSFYEYDYTTNGFTQVNGPTGTTLNNAPFVMSMLVLPDGNILLISGQGSTQLYVYTPGGTQLAAGQPAINSITENTDGSYHLTGTGLNGITSGAAYGDDWQMDSNYPLVRLTNTVSGNVYYARTYGWNSTSVMTGSRIVTTEFALPGNLPAGSYSLVVVANGNPSATYAFTYSPPATPTGLSAVIGNAKLTLSWNAVAGATAYDLKRSTTSGAYYTTIVTQVGTNFVNSGLTNGINYYYVVSAVGSGGPSPNSTELAAAPFGPPPTPNGLIAGPDSYPGITLSWNPTTAATSYNVKRSTVNGTGYATVANRTSPDYNDTNVVIGTPYYYVLSALSAGGESGNSAQATATATAGGDVTTGLVANWRFDENGGTTAADSTANNNTGTLVNGPTWVAPGRIGASALSFVATNTQSVTVANSGSLGMTAGISITAWINAIDWGGNRRILQKGNSDNQYRLLAENSVLKFHLNGVNSLTTALPPTNIWVHLAATWNGSTMTIYSNGVLVASLVSGGSIVTTADPLAIGTKNGSTTAGDLFNGTMDEVRVYNRALSLAEVNTVMHSGDGAPATPTGLTAGPANGLVGLSWNTVSNATTYNLKRSTVSGGPYTNIASCFSTAYNDTGLSNGTTYYYVVSAVNYTNESADSGQVSGRPAIGVAFYVDVNYTGGSSQILGAGNYTLTQLAAAGIGNDAASSCRIPAGWTVVIYQNDNFGGTSWTLTSDTPNFTAYSGLNDNMSSCKITVAALPGVPTALAGIAGDTTATLSWHTSAGATAYNLKRSTNSGGPYTIIAESTGTNFFDTGLTDGTNYYYVVSATSAAGESANSGQVIVTPSTPPPAPTGLTAVAGDTTVGLSWNPSTSAIAYNLQRSTNSGGPYAVVANLAGTNFTDNGVLNGTTYYYVVSATNSIGSSGFSSEVSATPAGAPLAPTGLSAVAGDTTVGLIWNASADSIAYNLQRATNSGGPYTIIANIAATNFTDTSVLNGMTYYYVVTATNLIGSSPFSTEVSATPASAGISLMVYPAAPGQFSFQFTGIDGHTYIVQMSTDLMSWVPVFTNQQSGGVFIYTDTNLLDPTRFYRVKP